MSIPALQRHRRRRYRRRRRRRRYLYRLELLIICWLSQVGKILGSLPQARLLQVPKLGQLSRDVSDGSVRLRTLVKNVPSLKIFGNLVIKIKTD